MQDQSFRALGISAVVAAALERRGIVTPFPIQALVLPDALAGLDVLAKAPTGSGKTLAFALPIVERATAGRRHAVRPRARPDPRARRPGGRVSSSSSAARKACASRPSTAAPRSRARRSAPAAPTSSSRPRAVSRISSSADSSRSNAIRTLILDEADRMLDMGFKPQVDRIVRRLPRAPPDDALLGDARRRGRRARPRVHEQPGPRRGAAPRQSEEQGEVEHTFVAVTADGKLDRLIEELEAERDLALVFVRTKRGADRLARKLHARDVPALALHGDMSQGQRERALARFRLGQGEDARRHRRRRPRPRPVRHHARDQLRPARGRQGLRPPGRPHRPSRARRPWDHVRPPRAAVRRRPRRRPARPRRTVRARGHARPAARSSSIPVVAAAARAGSRDGREGPASA